jgi:hypothetical protein
MDTITNVDVAAHWHEHHKDALGTDNEDTIKNTAVCFFHIAHAAVWALSTSGVRGNRLGWNWTVSN